VALPAFAAACRAVARLLLSAGQQSSAHIAVECGGPENERDRQPDGYIDLKKEESVLKVKSYTEIVCCTILKIFISPE